MKSLSISVSETFFSMYFKNILLYVNLILCDATKNNFFKSFSYYEIKLRLN